jgi:BirA family biotin operon repressor/biotin-[acetyl-CoA-carboxylase] ligase
VFSALPDDLDAAIELGRADLGPFAAVEYAAEVDSTNDLALALAAAGRPEGTSVVADLQRKGRGRRGRDWFSPPGAGLYLSVIVRPPPGAVLSLVTLGAGVALARAVTETTKLPVELKWPNDLVIGRPWRKMAGVLTEASSRAGRLDAVVIGIGVNLSRASYPRELADRATSIETELGRPIPRGTFLAALLLNLRRSRRWFDGDPTVSVPTEWRKFGRRAINGAAVRWEDVSGDRRGHARDIDADGALIVEVAGRRERVVGGEVTWEDQSRG